MSAIAISRTSGDIATVSHAGGTISLVLLFLAIALLFQESLVRQSKAISNVISKTRFSMLRFTKLNLG